MATRDTKINKRIKFPQGDKKKNDYEETQNYKRRKQLQKMHNYH